jgi:aspartyl-tRNA(Asn)/glutamyl-tRNA(Gln) amidotransferase subunit A
MITQKLEQIKSEKLSSEQNIKNYINKINKENAQINAVLHINPNAIEEAKEIDKKLKSGKAGKLAGLGFIVKSNINVKGLIANCASRTLENYNSTFDATVIKKLKEQDAIVLGMANMDEFAAGASGETSAFGPCKNPIATDKIPGGSSSGSAASVAAKFCDFSIGSDTGGSIRNPASHCGIVGFKPSYGAVSRYGLIDLSMSLDQIGPLANSTEDCKIIYDIIKGKDEKDAVSRDYAPEKKDIKKIQIGIPVISANKEIWALIKKRVDETCKKNNWKQEEINLSHMTLGIQTYYPIVYVEFFSGTRKFDGRRYGKKIEDSCGDEVLRRILGGQEISKAEFAGKYYRKALAAKKIIEKEFNDAFKKYDLLIMPTVPRLPHKIGEKISIEDMYNYDALTTLANLAEIPGISIPAGKLDNIPVGLQILAKKGNDDFLLEIAKEFEL